MSHVVHIPGGPTIQVAGADPRKVEQRRQESLHDMAMARTLVSSPAWEWFVAKCHMKAQAMEKQVTSVTADMNQRQEDRFRGMADAYRRMPGVVNEVAARYDRLQEQHQKEQQQ